MNVLRRPMVRSNCALTPKSTSFTSALSVNRTFWPLMSRWMTLHACKWVKPRKTSLLLKEKNVNKQLIENLHIWLRNSGFKSTIHLQINMKYMAPIRLIRYLMYKKKDIVSHSMSIQIVKMKFFDMHYSPRSLHNLIIVPVATTNSLQTRQNSTQFQNP